MKFVCGNMKMNGSLKMLPDYIRSLNELDADRLKNVCVCVQGPMLGFTREAKFNIGAQDCHHEEIGSFTGDTSAKLLAECGAKYVLVGHSERRKNHNENDNLVYQETIAASAAGITPIVCIGETQEQINDRFEVLRQQLSVLTPKPMDINTLESLIVAYEPVWAIGTGLVPDIGTIRSVCEFISESLIKIFSARIPVLYGGSVTKNNAKEIMSSKYVDGVLVGKACLDPTHFKEIIKLAV